MRIDRHKVKTDSSRLLLIGSREGLNDGRFVCLKCLQAHALPSN